MASIRPLITIAILGVVGAYLYVKINEGPAPSRAAANALSQSPEGVPPLTSTKGSTLAADSSAPAWPSGAPSMTPPATTPAPAAVGKTQSDTSSGTKDKDSVPAVPPIPELPPLPALTDSPASTTQSGPPLTKDLPAGSPANQAGQSTSTAAAKDTAAQPAPLSATDVAKPSTPVAAPQASAAVPITTPNATAGVTPPAASGATAASTAQNPLRSAAPASPPAVPATDDRYGIVSSSSAPAPLQPDPTTPIGAPAATSFAASWPAIQSALDRRDLKQAHQLLSKWHGDESLSPTDTQKVETLLSQLAGTVIYSTEHQLEPARVVKPGETLDTISKEYNVPSQLLAKINGIQPTGQLQPGQQLKVVRGPFAAVIDVSRSELTLTVDDRYAGKFHVTVPFGMALTDGQWLVDQKVAGATSTANPSAYATTPVPADRSIVLRNAASTAGGPATLVIASGSGIGLASNPPALRVSPQDAEEISDILSVGSRVVVRK